MEVVLSKAIPAFIAGIITFFAPCTLPLVPGYLGFISGVSLDELDGEDANKAKKKVLINSLLFILGFTIVFIMLGTVFGIFGSILSDFRIWLSRIGGLFVILFGLYMMGIFRLSFLDFLQQEHKLNISSNLKPGSPVSSILFGASFALGWSPCVGPVLGSILLLASSSTSVLQGAVLLFIFSIGLAVPFMAVALGFNKAQETINKLSKYLKAISFIGGIFLIFLGYLLFTNQFSYWNSLVFELLDWAKYQDFIYQYL
ncbi:MAG: cytochrome c biogenesis CcdA family protein [Candidatus Paceibacteria bacterium]